MPIPPQPNGERLLSEMKEFALFTKKVQRFIRQSLDVCYERGDPVATWGRTDSERHNVRAQQHNYQLLVPRIRRRVFAEVHITQIEGLMGVLVALSTFDMTLGGINCFAAYRFLYERMFGAEIRPWLPSAFCAAAASPLLHPDNRRVLLQSISQTAATAAAWSKTDPNFFPEWVDKVDTSPQPQLPAP